MEARVGSGKFSLEMWSKSGKFSAEIGTVWKTQSKNVTS